jgi:hypothetical protein
MVGQGGIREFFASAEEDRLAAQLAQVARRMRLAPATIGFMGGGRRLFISVDRDGKRTDQHTARDSPIRAGCLTKTLTAALVDEAVAEGRLDWHDAVAGVLGAQRIAPTQLTGVTVQHLLDHTHGLDAYSVQHLPRTATGLIDIKSLCEALATRALSAPGELYSYGDTGGWIAGAILETLYRKPYFELLCDAGLVQDRPVGNVCPSTGGSLRLATRQWLDFLETHAQRITLLAAEQVSLPGWSLLERAACRGWKSYSGGWLGHNSNEPGCSAVLRFHPHQRIGIIAAADGEGAAMLLLTGLLAHVFPELFTFQMPPLLAQSQASVLQLSHYIGEYARSDTKLKVTTGHTAPLSVRACESPACGSRELRAGIDDVFIPELRDDPRFPFLQFLRPNQSGLFEYAWNGRQLWRRE